MLDYSREDRFDDRLDPLFNLAGVFVLVALAFGMGYWTAYSDAKAVQAMAAEQQGGGSRR